jgi:hypothetical protein
MFQASRLLPLLAVLTGCAPAATANRVAVERADGSDGSTAVAGGAPGAGGIVGPGSQGGAAGNASSGGSGGVAGGNVGGSGGAEPTDGSPGGGGGAMIASGGAGGAVDATVPPEAAAETAMPATGPLAFLVVADPTAMVAADTKLKVLLEGKGFSVTIGDDDALASQTDGSTLVVLSGTCASEKIAAKYRDTAIPLLALEPASFDDMMMTGPGAMNYGEDNATALNITGADHPLAAQLKGMVTVVGGSTKLGWGKPSDSAQKVATLAGMNTKTAIFAYEKGVAMVAPFLAPARRVGLFVTATAGANLNADGEKLLAAAITWLKPGM